MHINPVELIRKKRNGIQLEQQEIEAFISGAVKGFIPDYQVAAFLMSTYFQGMDLTETVALTKAMIQSGKQVHFQDSRPKIDKHSTGGVGDKISLILAPLVASLDVDVPMVSGRGLGHTGGTLDKLESIPGFNVKLQLHEFTELVSKNGLAMMGQTNDFVPADKLLYALRDVTATVECIPLITASILSKKVAEGISGLVLDIKVGNGAFMKTLKDAEKLARSLVTVGSKLGLKVRALITDMNQPLGYTVGNSLEVLESIEVLKGKGPSDLKELTIELAAHMLILGEKCSSIAAARRLVKKALQNRTALEKFKVMIKAQGVNIDIVENSTGLPLSTSTVEVLSHTNGTVTKIDSQALGLLLVDLGGGRCKTTDTIDHGVGFLLHAKVGSYLEKGEPLMTIYYNPQKLAEQNLKLETIIERTQKTYSLQNKKAGSYHHELIKKVIT